MAKSDQRKEKLTAVSDIHDVLISQIWKRAYLGQDIEVGYTTK
jgi:hypothetical protein